MDWVNGLYTGVKEMAHQGMFCCTGQFAKNRDGLHATSAKYWWFQFQTIFTQHLTCYVRSAIVGTLLNAAHSTIL